MVTVRQLLESKQDKRIFTISPNETTYEALKIMAEHNVGAVVVMENNRLAGLVSEREYSRRIALEGKSSKLTPVRETMNTKLLVIDPDKTVEDCMALMTDKHIRYLPVIEDNHFIGIVSIGDVVKSIIAQQKRNIEHLERYVTGGEYGF
jgi:CBS domain-containing protein